MSQFRTIACCVAVLALVQLPAGLAAQPASQHLGQSVAWEVFLEGPENLIAGVVLDERGSPLAGFLVRLADTEVGTMTDSQGRFEVLAPDAGDWLIQIEGGAVRVEQTLTLPRGSHIRAVALLNTRVPLCGLRVCGGAACEDLALDVVDAKTGSPPSVDITIRLEHESGVKTATRRFNPRHRMETTFVAGFGEPVQTAGFHNIEVTAPGYLAWRVERVWLELTQECHPILVGRNHVVRLQPIRD